MFPLLMELFFCLLIIMIKQRAADVCPPPTWQPTTSRTHEDKETKTTDGSDEATAQVEVFRAAAVVTTARSDDGRTDGRTARPRPSLWAKQNKSTKWVEAPAPVYLPPLWRQPASLVFNYLGQYGRIELQHMSQIIKCINTGVLRPSLRDAEITSVICSPGSKQSGNIPG